jgi:hypothetical protein
MDINDDNVIFGELSPNCLHLLNNCMELTYQPMIEQIEGWGECEEESVEDFKKTTKIFANELNYCLKSLSAD